MKLLEALLNCVIHNYKLRGRNSLIKIITWFASNRLFVRSVYGIYIREKYEDATWRACCLGYERSKIPNFVERIPDGGCFVDIGANIGIFSLLAAKSIGANGLVVSFEPHPATFQDLVRNIERNRLNCMMLPLNMGLSNKTMVAGLSHDSNHSGTSHIAPPRASNDRSIVVCSWQDVSFVENIISHRDTYIKIDVEGMELLVIKAAESFLRQTHIKMIAVEIDGVNLSRYESTPVQVYEKLHNYGFRPTVNVDVRQLAAHYDEIFVRITS